MRFNVGEIIALILMVSGCVIAVSSFFVEKENLIYTLPLGTGLVIGGTCCLFIFFGLGEKTKCL